MLCRQSAGMRTQVPRRGGVRIAGDGEVAFSREHVDDRRARRGVLRERLTGGECEEHEFDSVGVRECLAQDAALGNGGLGQQVRVDGG